MYKYGKSYGCFHSFIYNRYLYCLVITYTQDILRTILTVAQKWWRPIVPENDRYTVKHLFTFTYLVIDNNRTFIFRC